ncbi:MAG: DUF3822 family protein [Bacteroidales bacterium]|nr:DUF3822 family protein [Bacteroidales bacterium]
MKNFFVFNEGFSKSKTSSYILSLQLDEKGYSYTIIDTVGKIYAAVNHHNFDKKLADKSISEKAESMIKEDLFLSKNYKAVYFSLITHKSTLVPNELFNRNNIKQYFTFNHYLDEYEELHFNFIEQINAYNIFAVPSDLTTLLVNKFPEIIFVHQNNTIISDIVERAKKKKYKMPLISINVNQNLFDIAIYKDDKFVLLNSYLFNDENDLVYYVMNTLTQFGIKPAKSYINLSGFVEKNTKFYKLIREFFPNINLLKLESEISYNFIDVDEHLVYILLNLHNAYN